MGRFRFMTEMDTYGLLGDPDKKDGMCRKVWETNYEKHLRKGSARTTWLMRRENIPAKTQVVVIRTGAVRGIIGFGHRVTGSKEICRNQLEDPILLTNMRSLDDNPFITLEEMVEQGWSLDKNGRVSAPQKSGVRLVAKLRAVEDSCEKLLGLSLTTLCTLGPVI